MDSESHAEFNTHSDAGRIIIKRKLKREYRSDSALPDRPAQPYTAKQGQYLAFIFYYTKIHRRAPAEADMQKYFGVSPPSVHQMILTLERRGLIQRVPGQARSIRLVIPPEQLPKLE